MIQYVIVFLIVAVCTVITIRMIYRVLAGKSVNCSMCEKCDVTRKADDNSCASSESCSDNSKP